MSEKAKRGFYARVMGTFWRHPRTCGLSLQARGLWVSMLSWCADQLSDGAVPDSALLLIAGGAPPKRHVDELAAAGLLERDDAAKSWRLREWSDHNITREKYEKEKERARNGMARARDVTRNIDVTAEPVTANKAVSNRPPSDQDQDQDKTLTSVSVSRARAPSSEPARKAIEAAYRARKLSVPGRIAALTPSYEDSGKLAGLDMATLPGLLEAFFADPAMKAKGHPVGYFLENPNQWTPATAQAQTSTKPLPADLHDHERTLIVAAREGRWWRDREKWDRHYRALLERHPGIAPTPPWWSEEAA